MHYTGSRASPKRKLEEKPQKRAINGIIHEPRLERYKSRFLDDSTIIVAQEYLRAFTRVFKIVYHFPFRNGGRGDLS